MMATFIGHLMFATVLVFILIISINAAANELSKIKKEAIETIRLTKEKIEYIDQLKAMGIDVVDYEKKMKKYYNK